MKRTYQDLAAFQRALDLVVAVYEVTAVFPKHELYGLTSQMRRASVGVMSQIAEGQGRLTYGEWRQFLSQARGSLFEVESEAIAANRLGFLDDAAHHMLKRHIALAASALAGLIRWVRAAELKHRTTRQPVNRTTSNAAPRVSAPHPPPTPPRT